MAKSKLLSPEVQLPLGAGFMLGIATSRIFSADHHVIVLCWILGGCAWACFAMGAYQANIFHKLRDRRKRRLAQIALQLFIPLLLWFGWRYGPWAHAPRLATTHIPPFYFGQDEKGWANVTLEDKSDDEISGFEWDSRIKLVPFDVANAKNPDYQATEAATGRELFDELDNSTLLVPEPPAYTINAWQTTVISPRTDAPVAEDQRKAFNEKRMLAFLAVRVLYSDLNGCKYRTEIFGFFAYGSLMANSHSHFKQGEKLPAPCR